MRKSASIPAALLLPAAGALSDAARAADPVGRITHLSGTLTAKQADGSTKLISVKSQGRRATRCPPSRTLTPGSSFPTAPRWCCGRDRG